MGVFTRNSLVVVTNPAARVVILRGPLSYRGEREGRRDGPPGQPEEEETAGRHTPRSDLRGGRKRSCGGHGHSRRRCLTRIRGPAGR